MNEASIGLTSTTFSTRELKHKNDELELSTHTIIVYFKPSVKSRYNLWFGVRLLNALAKIFSNHKSYF
ncbi:hypothetical protein [Dapis sp. BLCC M229]|uniref:hypothetical protein n=1 Tax=Dapis sp. BLCC M229 TaxID=3400188 RepID=UPI003CEBA51F